MIIDPPCRLKSRPPALQSDRPAAQLHAKHIETNNRQIIERGDVLAITILSQIPQADTTILFNSEPIKHLAGQRKEPAANPRIANEARQVLREEVPLLARGVS